MNKLIDSALGIHPQALSVGARRLEVLAANMANADTPEYKARDVDFRSALSDAVSDRSARSGANVRRTNTAHLPGAVVDAPELRYRVPNQPSLDGNTVDAQMEQAAFSEAAVRYQASLDFLAGRIEGLRKALRGE
jgi:flagellar basal-body rod protein FlgB